jgi:hypothetical protein
MTASQLRALSAGFWSWASSARCFLEHHPEASERTRQEAFETEIISRARVLLANRYAMRQGRSRPTRDHR